MFGSLTSRISGIGSSIGQQYSQMQNYPYFAVVFMIGLGSISLSFFMLPWIVVRPQAVANLMNLGSLTIMASFAVLWGPQ